jgi:hypothetical protein
MQILNKEVADINVTLVGSILAWSFTKLSYILTDESFLALMSSLTGLCFFVITFVKLINLLIDTVPVWIDKTGFIFIKLKLWKKNLTGKNQG